MRDLNLPKGINEARFESRKEWKTLVDEHFRRSEKDDSLATMDSFYQRAYELLVRLKRKTPLVSMAKPTRRVNSMG